MSTVEEITSAIALLSSEQVAQIRAWLAEYEERLWDEQIEQDERAGRLDTLAERAMAEQRLSSGKCKFLYKFTDLSEDGMLSVDLDPPRGAVVRIDLEQGDKIWLSANRVDWLHLARVCSELGMGNYKPGFHFHRRFDFGESDGREAEISFEVRGEEK